MNSRQLKHLRRVRDAILANPERFTFGLRGCIQAGKRKQKPANVTKAEPSWPRFDQADLLMSEADWERWSFYDPNQKPAVFPCLVHTETGSNSMDYLVDRSAADIQKQIKELKAALQAMKKGKKNHANKITKSRR